MNCRQICTVVLLVATGAGSAWRRTTHRYRSPKTSLIAFLGDSITQQDLYTRDVELLLNVNYPDLHLHFVNAGWSGRHAAHLMDDAVLNRDLLRLKPDMVLIHFGMNDGWYRFPPAPAAMAAYQANMDDLVSKIQTALPTTQIVLLTPTITDPIAVPSLKGYNNTLGQMAGYVSDLAARRGLPLIDLFTPDVAGRRGGESDHPQLQHDH